MALDFRTLEAEQATPAGAQPWAAEGAGWGVLHWDGGAPSLGSSFPRMVLKMERPGLAWAGPGPPGSQLVEGESRRPLHGPPHWAFLGTRGRTYPSFPPTMCPASSSPVLPPGDKGPPPTACLGCHICSAEGRGALSGPRGPSCSLAWGVFRLPRVPSENQSLENPPSSGMPSFTLAQPGPPEGPGLGKGVQHGLWAPSPGPALGRPCCWSHPPQLGRVGSMSVSEESWAPRWE